MSETPTRLSDRAGELRLAFDRSFAVPPRLAVNPEEDFLGIRLADQPYAIRLSEIGGLFAAKTITRVPSPASSLLGIAGFRGAIAPVYDLHALLGHPKAAGPRWLAIAAGAAIAFAFGGFDGHLRISRDAILQQQGDGHGRQSVREFMHTPDTIRPIVHIPSVLDAIRRQSRDTALTKER